MFVDFKLIKPDTHLKFVDMDLLGLNRKIRKIGTFKIMKLLSQVNWKL